MITGQEFILVVVLIFDDEARKYEFRQSSMAECTYRRDSIMAAWVKRPYSRLVILGDCLLVGSKKKTR